MRIGWNQSELNILFPFCSVGICIKSLYWYPMYSFSINKQKRWRKIVIDFCQYFKKLLKISFTETLPHRMNDKYFNHLFQMFLNLQSRIQYILWIKHNFTVISIPHSTAMCMLQFIIYWNYFFLSSDFPLATRVKHTCINRFNQNRFDIKFVISSC